MAIRGLRYLALLGCTASLLNWNGVFGMDDKDFQLDKGVKLTKEDHQISRLVNRLNGLEEKIVLIEQKSTKHCQSSSQFCSEVIKLCQSSNQFCSEVIKLLEVYQFQLSDPLPQIETSSMPMPRAVKLPPAPPPPSPALRKNNSAPIGITSKSPLSAVHSGNSPRRSTSSFAAPTLDQLLVNRANLRSVLPLGPLPEEKVDTHSQLLAEIRKKMSTQLNEDDMTLLNEIHRAIENKDFEPRFVAVNKPSAPKSQQGDFLTEMKTQMENMRIAMNENPNEDEEGWDDGEVCNSVDQDADTSKEDELSADLQKFERITEINREAILNHNQGTTDIANKLVPMPPRGSHKNEMLLWEWNYYKTAGQKKIINTIVRGYIVKEQEMLKQKYSNFDPKKAVLSYKTSRLIVPHSTPEDASMWMSVCF